MVKSWLSFLLPDDEYKKQRILYFLAEASIVLVIFLLISFGLNEFNPQWALGVNVVAGFGIAILAVYVTLRYTFSGIEYTDIVTKEAYSKEKKNIIFKSVIFVVIFFVVTLLVTGYPASNGDWFDFVGLLVCVGIAMFLINYVSLKQSYKKNKSLVDVE